MINTVKTKAKFPKENEAFYFLGRVESNYLNHTSHLNSISIPFGMLLGTKMDFKYHTYRRYRQGICSSYLTLSLTLNFIFAYCSRACPYLKINI